MPTARPVSSLSIRTRRMRLMPTTARATVKRARRRRLEANACVVCQARCQVVVVSMRSSLRYVAPVVVALSDCGCSVGPGARSDRPGPVVTATVDVVANSESTRAPGNSRCCKVIQGVDIDRRSDSANAGGFWQQGRSWRHNYRAGRHHGPARCRPGVWRLSKRAQAEADEKRRPGANRAQPEPARCRHPRSTQYPAGRCPHRPRRAVKKLQAERDGKQEAMNRHRVAAPFTGVVARKLVEVGEWVAPGTPVVELVSDKQIFIDVFVPQEFYPRLDDGMSVELTFAALPGTRYAAKAVATAPVTDPVTRSFGFARDSRRGGRPESPRACRPQATLTFTSDEQVIVVPKDAVIRHADSRTTVWTVDMDDGGGESLSVAEKVVRLGPGDWRPGRCLLRIGNRRIMSSSAATSRCGPGSWSD